MDNVSVAQLENFRLKVFRTVAQHLSFRKAAERLFITQPAVTLQIKALEESVARQTGQITAFQKQLDEAKQQVQDIAVKAIEGASGARALTHVNQIAMEQAKTRAGQV